MDSVATGTSLRALAHVLCCLKLPMPTAMLSCVEHTLFKHQYPKILVNTGVFLKILLPAVQQIAIGLVNYFSLIQNGLSKEMILLGNASTTIYIKRLGARLCPTEIK